MRGITALIVTLIVAAVVGIGAYQLGVAQGLATNGAPAVAPVAYYHPFFWGGFGFLGFLFPLLFIFLIFALARGFWGGRRYYGGWGHYYGDPDARFAEWHKRMHGESTTSEGTSTTPPTGR
jgi:hypothetical protein